MMGDNHESPDFKCPMVHQNNGRLRLRPVVYMVVGGCLLALLGNGAAMWRQQGVIENDIVHLATQVERIEAKLDRLLWEGEPKR